MNIPHRYDSYYGEGHNSSFTEKDRSLGSQMCQLAMETMSTRELYELMRRILHRLGDLDAHIYLELLNRANTQSTVPTSNAPGTDHAA